MALPSSVGEHPGKIIPGTFTIGVILAGTAAITAGNYGAFWVAPFRCKVIGMNAIWGVVSTSGTLQVERLQGTEAKDAGDDLLSSVITMSTTANTVNAGTLVTTNVVTLSAGDRLGLVNAGTLTGQDQLVVTVELEYTPLP